MSTIRKFNRNYNTSANKSSLLPVYRAIPAAVNLIGEAYGRNRAKEIRNLKAMGLSTSEIASAYSSSVQAISQLLKTYPLEEGATAAQGTHNPSVVSSTLTPRTREVVSSKKAPTTSSTSKKTPSTVSKD